MSPCTSNPFALPAISGLLRAAGESSHGLARQNYALVQLMLQTGLRISEVAMPAFILLDPSRLAP